METVVPLLARIYPNGTADVNHFHAAGGTGFVIRELIGAGLLHEEARFGDIGRHEVQLQTVLAALALMRRLMD